MSSAESRRMEIIFLSRRDYPWLSTEITDNGKQTHKQENHDATLKARPGVQRAMQHVHGVAVHRCNLPAKILKE